ncbi:MAG: acylphosphatase [Lactobacillus sp.]|jgi:acylphosphatase|nr:acylphosphatase [Lactobacillus sp.]
MQRGVSLTVFGRVQGVGFRYTTVMLAKKFDIKGTVKNNSDNSVSIQAVGETRNLQAFVTAIKAGPSPYARVQKVLEQELRPLPDFGQFNVIG